ncbi:short transient receptor potential channel 3-like [Diachasma alloeum]|uniref:short transient receptor potential channel 3-like n=1 Tax=Diachasma alloeum TaxID=454923 RepID=UPI0010FAF1B5|nr:short transient receptor potential channel 3-like [Diachasma alloeum]
MDSFSLSPQVSFSLYMLVSVIVLINLLIAMMSDTYQSIQSQSDIEWKYGLSKLIRKMQKTRTAPSPLNLITTWVTYLVKVCQKRKGRRKRMSVMHGFAGSTPSRNRLSRDKLLSIEGHKSTVGFSRLQSPVGSQLSFKHMPSIDSVVDWDLVRKKYRMRFGDLVEKPSGIDTGAGELM